eukprot:4838966-Heterocapsa_arctica.AAC.2
MSRRRKRRAGRVPTHMMAWGGLGSRRRHPPTSSHLRKPGKPGAQETTRKERRPEPGGSRRRREAGSGSGSQRGAQAGSGAGGVGRSLSVCHGPFLPPARPSAQSLGSSHRE